MFCVIFCEALAVQPLGPVTVTVYVPGALTRSVEFVPNTEVPLDHENVPPPLAFKAIVVNEQVRIDVVGGVIVAVGKIVFCVII